ncbi:MAG: glutamate synthase large subunit [Clostridiales bacterium]
MQEYSFLPKPQGLYDPGFEHDSCGVGFIANIKGKKSHEIIRNGVQILENLSHRGACGCDPLTGDGAGIMIQIPDGFFRKNSVKLNIDLPMEGYYGVGFIFLPQILEERSKIELWFERIIREEGQKFLGWREVPHDSSQIGTVARSVEPVLRQIFIGLGSSTKPEDFERKLYIIRKLIWNKVDQSDLYQKNFFYIASLSSRTIVYKGQLLARQLDQYYPDLADPEMNSAIAMIHSRYSTNTFPTWALAHPYRMIAHNGEINTLRGNVNWMHAREIQMESDIFKDEIKKILRVVAPNKSDSASFDNVLEMLVISGRSIPLAMMMMIPEAWKEDRTMTQEKKDFYKYHSCLMEPWDGPASITFSDGRYVGAVLDRNGLRPSRYWVTKDDTVIMASESGVLPVEPENIVLKGRLQPGKMFLVDTQLGKIIDDDELKHHYATKNPYGKWLKENMIEIDDLPQPKEIYGLDENTLIQRQKTFGYSLEDSKLIIQPMAIQGQEAIGSMGNDTPLALLSYRTKLLYNYFKQMFAQVTNPPIDPIREEIVMSSDILLGREGNLLKEIPENCRRLRVTHPIINNRSLEKIRELNKPGLKSKTISAVFRKKDGPKGLEKRLEKIFKETDQLIKQGYSIVILSDRDVNEMNVPIPALLSCAGLHHHLVRKGTRTKVSIVVETGEAREMHHFAVLFGYGAEVINPYLVFETIGHEIKKGLYPDNLSYEKAEQNFLKACKKGIFKIMAKMGISTLQSYCNAQIFEAVGLNEELVEKYFTATPSRIGGIGIPVIAEGAIKRHNQAYSKTNVIDENTLPSGGEYKWRIDGEYHQYNPQTVALLQQAVRTGDFKIYLGYAKIVNEKVSNLTTLRRLLKFKKTNPIALEEVEPASEIVKRFATGAMSYGSISKEAHETLAIAMNRLGGFSNTGEGGEDSERYLMGDNGDSKRSRIKQIAPGRFGVTIEYLVNADQLQIKMAQGAKPGEGGQLPGHKVTSQIAKTRHTIAGVGLISPPPHHDIYSIEDLAQLIYDLKNANSKADISVKLVSEAGVGTIAAGVAKAKADHILISGYEGGTGASPLTSIKHTGLPMELGIAETQQVLVLNDLRGRVRLQADGQIKTGRDVVITAMLGADEFGFATSALVSMGCTLQRKCHMNSCSVGIATQDEELRKNFAGKPEHVINFFHFVAEEVRMIMAELGFRKFEELIGRVDLLEAEELPEHWKASGIDFTRILHKPQVTPNVSIRHVAKQLHELDKAIDLKLIEACSDAVENKTPVKFSSKISNTDLAVGTMLSSEIARRYSLKGLKEDTIQIDFEGSAGQSFGAFLSKGVTLTLEGDANDYVGKGLSGGKIVIYPPKKSTFIPENNIIVGNVVLYGATSGEVYFRGLAGERFAVRNSGANAVVEGIGDHGCEYMTGGRVVILGPTGKNFGAGMSGGIAYVWNRVGSFQQLCNQNMVELNSVEDEKDEAELWAMIEKHLRYTNSSLARQILSDWKEILPQFIKVFPKEYKRVLEEESAKQLHDAESSEILNNVRG